uniref:Fertility inhibition protein n=2 Tax=Escherichia coli TaxID=562 RepID=A0A1I7P2R2_ECOLX|nr:FinO [Escherichia coli]
MWYLWPQEDDSSEAEHSMTEQKRPVLTLKRKTEGGTPVRSRKTIINVTTPPKWKVKKQKLAEKAAREAELAAKKAQARQALSIYLNLPTLDEAVNTLKPWWPGLFDGDTPRLLACGIRDVLLEDVSKRNIPLSHKKLRRALKAITRSESYLCALKAGACRYDTEGYVTEHISQEEEAYAAARLAKIRCQNRRKAELQAVLDEQ